MAYTLPPVFSWDGNKSTYNKIQKKVSNNQHQLVVTNSQFHNLTGPHISHRGVTTNSFSRFESVPHLIFRNSYTNKHKMLMIIKYPTRTFNYNMAAISAPTELIDPTSHPFASSCVCWACPGWSSLWPWEGETPAIQTCSQSLKIITTVSTTAAYLASSPQPGILSWSIVHSIKRIS